MSRIVTSIGKQLINMVLVLIITSGSITLVSWIGGFSLPKTFLLIGIIYTLIGVFSCLGNYKVSTDIGYHQVKSVSSAAYYSNSMENFEPRNNFKLLVTSCATGFVLMIISGALETSNISVFAINVLKSIL